MNKEVARAIELGCKSLRINTGAKADANRAAKRPSTEVHKVNECVRLMMQALLDKGFAAEVDPEAKDQLWGAWLAVNQALSAQVGYERELRGRDQA